MYVPMYCIIAWNLPKNNKHIENEVVMEIGEVNIEHPVIETTVHVLHTLYGFFVRYIFKNFSKHLLNHKMVYIVYDA